MDTTPRSPRAAREAAILTLLVAVCAASGAGTPCAVSVGANPNVHYWLEHFFGDRIDLVAEDQHAFAFGTANATIDPSQLPDAQPNEARTYWLVPELPFIFSDGHPAVELGDPDSFIDIIDGKTRSIYRVVSIGTPGLLANAFWVAPLRFAVIFVDYLPGSDQPGNTYLTCYDLGTWSSERFSPAAPPKPLDRDAVAAYLIRTHHP